MARNTRRRSPTPAEVAAIRRMIEQSQRSEWFRRWYAAIPHAVKAYAAAIREAGDQAIEKYRQGLERSAKLKSTQSK